MAPSLELPSCALPQKGFELENIDHRLQKQAERTGPREHRGAGQLRREAGRVWPCLPGGLGWSPGGWVTRPARSFCSRHKWENSPRVPEKSQELVTQEKVISEPKKPPLLGPF